MSQQLAAPTNAPGPQAASSTALRLWLSAYRVEVTLFAIAFFVRGLGYVQQRRAAAWSLIVIATILCFGYVGEMRHYLLLTAFWFTYAWPAAIAGTSQLPTPATA